MTIEIITDNDGTTWYFKNSKLHCEDGPAVIFPNGDQWWYQNNQRHRDDGPAVIYPDGRQMWYQHGFRYTFNDWCKVANISGQQKTLLMLKYNIHT